MYPPCARCATEQARPGLTAVGWPRLAPGSAGPSWHARRIDARAALLDDPSPHPRGYLFGTNVSTLRTEELPAAEIVAAEAGRLKPRDVTVMNPSWAGAAGAAISTAQDLDRWAKGLCDGSLLDARWQRRRLQRIRPVNPAQADGPGYGLALGKFGAPYGHTGELPAVGSA